MKKNILIAYLVFNWLIGFSRQNENYERNVKGIEIVNKAFKSIGWDTLLNTELRFNIEGAIYHLGHLPLPEQTNQIKTAEKYVVRLSEDNYIASLSINMYNRDFNKTIFVKKDSSFHDDFFNKNMIKEKSVAFKSEIITTIPLLFLIDALHNIKTIDYCGEVEVDGKKYFNIAYNNQAGAKYYILINAATYQVVKLSEPGYSNIYGDYYSEKIFSEYENKNGINLPHKRVDYSYEQKEKEVSITYLPAKTTWADMNLSFKVDSLVFFKNSKHDSSITAVKISASLLELKLESLNNKIFVVNTKNHISVFEAPAGVKESEMVMSHIEKLFPNKKIKYVCPSHHHPDHAGGIAKYINHGVTVITTKNNTEYFTKISKRNHHFVNYNNTLADKPVFEMVPNGGSKIFKDDTYSFTCYEVGNEIEHTKEYLVTYFPKERILLVADLIQFPISAPKTSFGNRGKALVSLIEKEGLRVDKIYTSWPLKGQKEFGTFTELKKGIPD